MNPDLPAVDVALADVRKLLHAAGVPFELRRDALEEMGGE
jgi:hypothetical protein